MFEKLVKEWVEYRGYGPWYQQDAWNTVRDWPVEYGYGAQLMIYLDERYPALERE